MPTNSKTEKEAGKRGSNKVQTVNGYGAQLGRRSDGMATTRREYAVFSLPQRL